MPLKMYYFPIWSHHTLTLLFFIEIWLKKNWHFDIDESIKIMIFDLGDIRNQESIPRFWNEYKDKSTVET